MSSWPYVVLLLAMRGHYGGHLTEGQPDPKADQMSSWPEIPLPVGYIWPQIYVTKVVTHMATRCLPGGGSGWHFVWWAVSQPACQLQLASQPAMWQNINLSGLRLARYLVAGGPGAWPHWAPVQDPSTPTGSPWGVTYLTKARQVTELSSAARYIPLALCLETICSFVAMLPNHIFLHTL